MKQRKWILPAALALLLALAVVPGVVSLNRLFQKQVNEERKHQLEELTAQLSDTFENALDFNSACAGTAAKEFAEQEYASEEELIRAAARIQDTVLTGEEKSGKNDGIFFLVDEDGVCYDEDGRQGIWGDFDQIVDMGDSCTFIADSVNFEGVHWAFVRKLDEPVATADGEITVCYVVLLKTVQTMSLYYKSEAYDDVCETYILKSNGTRMYDSVTEDDTISAYNVYKNLREEAESRGESFDDILETLQENSVACGNYSADGTDYIYSLAWQREYNFVLLFLIPASEVAANTLNMVSLMSRMFLIFCALLLVFCALAVVAVVQLLSSRKLAELKEQNLKNAQTANERLAKVNESLMHANMAAENALDIARSANQAKSNFLSNMSHDIRTPLNAIIGFLQLLEKDADNPDKVMLYSRKIRVSSQHLLSLINDILDMSRIESGKTTLNLKTFSMEKLIADIETVIRPQIQEKQQTLHVRIAGEAKLSVVGDDLRLTQILMNLLTNAVKYTPAGGSVWFTVELAQPGRGGAAFRFQVKDNGIGMSPEFQKRIFDPFEREQTSTTSGIQGTGLGMAITKNLVDLMGGIIQVESAPGEGSTFTLELALSLAPEAAQESAAAETGTETGSAPGSLRRPGSADPEDTAMEVPQNAENTTAESPQQAGTAPGRPVAHMDAAASKMPRENTAENTEAAAETAQQPPLPAEPEENILKGRHFLVAEDNEINAEIIGELLAMEEASCEIAPNGIEALRILEESEPGSFDAIFMDIQMPVLDGYETARRIRASQHPDARTIPIVAMTANAFAEDVKKALDAGMNAHIPKPVDMKKIREFMEQSAAKKP